MFQFIKQFILSTKSADVWLKILVVLIFAYFFLRHKTQKKYGAYEGFDQTSDYRVLTNAEVYDEFYLSIYDDLFPFEQEKQAVDFALDDSVPGKNASILVIGGIPGQGISAHLEEKEYKNVKLIEKSRVGMDAVNPMMFEKGEFTHIFCLGETIYENQEKTKIVENCRKWLNLGGYFVFSLLKPKIYSFIPSTNANDASAPAAKTQIDFDDFEYRCLVDVKKEEIVRKETFTDKKTKKVRENIQSFFVEPRETMDSLLKKCGFFEKMAVDHKNGMHTLVLG